MVEELKANLGIAEVSTSFLATALGKEGSFDCPFCGRRKKLSVYQNAYFTCHHPACAKRGDIFDLIQAAGVAADFQQAVAKISSLSGKPHANFASSVLDGAWSLMRSAVDSSPEALDFCEARKISPKDVGFCPRKLLSRHFAPAQLQEVGLLSKGKGFLDERVVFPLHDHRGNLVHLQGRALDDNPLRWLSTRRDKIPSVDNFTFNTAAFEQARKHQMPLFLCEGATDTFALKALNVAAVGVAGVRVSLTRHARALEGVPAVVALFDNDRFSLGTPLAGQYKSWSFAIPELVQLQLLRPDLLILCLPPPSRPGLTDVGDWIEAGLTKRQLVQETRSAQSLGEFVLNILPSHDDLLREALLLTDCEGQGYQDKLRTLLPDSLELGRRLL